MRENSIRKIMSEEPFVPKQIRLHGGTTYLVPSMEYYLVSFDNIHIRLPAEDLDEYIPFTAIASIKIVHKRNGGSKKAS